MVTIKAAMGSAHAQAIEEITPSQPDTRDCIIGVLVWGALILLLYHSILAKLVTDWWRDPNFSHGFIVPLFSAFLLWKDRKNLLGLPRRPSWMGVVIIAGALAMLTTGVFGAELFLSRTSLLFLLAGMVICFLGWGYFRAVLFPWLFLFLMIPIPVIVFNHITLPLQLLASKLAADFLTIVGIPVLREGNIIQLPAMPLEVAEACSGIRSLMSLTTLAVIYGYVLDSSNWRRGALVIAAIPIAVIANGSRILGTGLLVEYWDPEKALGFFHEFSGWLIFLVSVILLLAVHKLLSLVKLGRRSEV